jgi:ferredoxin
MRRDQQADGCLMADPQARLTVDRIVCDGSGLCAELLPELIAVDDWGYPILKPDPVPGTLLPLARRAVADCPVLALRLETQSQPGARLSPGVLPRRS